MCHAPCKTNYVVTSVSCRGQDMPVTRGMLVVHRSSESTARYGKAEGQICNSPITVFAANCTWCTCATSSLRSWSLREFSDHRSESLNTVLTLMLLFCSVDTSCRNGIIYCVLLRIPTPAVMRTRLAELRRVINTGTQVWLASTKGLEGAAHQHAVSARA